MGGRKAGFDTNRTEFMSESALDGDIEYQRSGGCFVTTKKAIALVMLAVFALVAVGASIYFYGTNNNANESGSGSTDIEKLLNDSIFNSDGEDIRLPSYILPLHYRLRIHPLLDEPNSDNFTFTGQVAILIQCTKETKKIVLNSEILDIYSEEVTVVTTKSLRLRSLSQLAESKSSGISSEHNGIFNSNLMDTQNAEVTTVTQSQLNVPLAATSAESISNMPPGTTPGMAVPTKGGIHTTTIVPDAKPAAEAAPSSSQPPAPASASVPSQMTTPNPSPFPQPLPNPAANETVPAAEEPQPSNSNETHPNISNNEGINRTLNEPKLTEESVSVPSIEPVSSPASIYKASKILHVDIKMQEKITDKGRYVIHLATALEPGTNYTLNIKFSGKISNSLIGLYKTSYSDNEGRKRWLVTTQLQPVFARRVFPCFDEPSFKSTFEISVARRTNMVTLSNMPLKESEQMANQTGWVWDHFEKSPPMSTHLVAFTVCDFESLQPATAELGPVFKIWAPKHVLNTARYATDVGPKILSYLQNYFGIKYPLSKIDLVAVPELSRTATGNWGIILFRDTALLLDPSATSWETRNHIFKTITSKLTKQWFGNLVTTNWWSELWLNEGIATYMADVVENAIDPSLEDLDTFSLRITQTILDSDKLKFVRSLNIDIKDPTQIEQVFDDVTFNKGSCLIRMLNYTVTEPLFKEALQSYLKEWMYKSSNQDDFWESFSYAVRNSTVMPSDLTVKEFMDSWIKQEGYPLVTVTRSYNTGNTNITQNRFVHGNGTHNNLWYIPLTYTRQNENDAISTLWLNKEKSAITVNFTKPGNDTWVLFNIEEAGFYRVNYDITNWRLLQNQLMNDAGKIMPSNRGQLLNDAFELANAGALDYRIPFELTKYLGPKERNYIPWYSFFSSFKSLHYIVGSTYYNGMFEQYILNIIKPVYNELGTTGKPNESQNEKLLRSLILEVACRINYDPCLKWAKQKYQEWMASSDPDKNNPIEYEFREIIQCSAVQTGGQREWNFLWQRTLSPSVSSINLKTIYGSLGCSREPWIINSYLEKSLNGSIALQNVPYVWKSIAHPVGLSVGFAFFRTNWKRIYDSYKHIYNNLKSIFEDFLSKLSTEIDLEDLVLFYNKNSKDSLQPVSSLILNVVDRIKWRIYWRQSHLKTVAAWLVENN